MDGFKDWCENIKMSNIWGAAVLQDKREGMGQKKIPIMMKDIKFEIQEAHQIPRRINTQETTPRTVILIVILLNSKGRKKAWK